MTETNVSERIQVLKIAKAKAKPKRSQEPKKQDVGRAENRPQNSEQQCSRCGEQHDPKTCKIKKEKCFQRGKVGHTKRACRTLASKATPVKTLECSDDESSSSDLNHLSTAEKREPICVDLALEGTQYRMEIDTGAAVTVVGEASYQTSLGHIPLVDTSLQLRTYTGETVKTLGKCIVKVTYEEQEKRLPLYVVKGRGPALIGREWLREITLNWQLLKMEVCPRGLDRVLERHRTVFTDELGCLKDIKAKFTLKEGAHPRFWKPRPVALARKPTVDKQLKNVSHSEWAAPLVPLSRKMVTSGFVGTLRLQLILTLRLMYTHYLVSRISMGA